MKIAAQIVGALALVHFVVRVLNKPHTCSVVTAGHAGVGFLSLSHTYSLSLSLSLSLTEHRVDPPPLPCFTDTLLCACAFASLPAGRCMRYLHALLTRDTCTGMCTMFRGRLVVAATCASHPHCVEVLASFRRCVRLPRQL
jgi:hypothetical protein